MLVGGLLFFLMPILAAAVGVRPTAFENRPLVGFPSLRSGTGFFAEFDRWAVDHLPLREAAVRANTAASERIFGQAPDYGSAGHDRGGPGVAELAGAKSPAHVGAESGAAGTDAVAEPENDGGAQRASSYPIVVAGKSGWLFFGDDVALACQPALDLDEIFARWRRLTEMIERSGRRVIVTVAPDKSTVASSYLLEDYAGRSCSQRRRDELWDRLDRGELGPAYLDLRGPLQRQQEQDGRPIYWPGDSHWAPRAEVVYAQQVVGRLAPDLVTPSDVRAAPPEDRTGELTRLIGHARSETAPGWKIQRPGVTTPWWWQYENTLVGRHRSTTSAAPLIRERAALIGDSFTFMSLPEVVPYFADLTLVSRRNGSFNQKAAAILDAHTVILQTVERRFTNGTANVIDPGFLDRLERDVAPTSTETP